MIRPIPLTRTDVHEADALMAIDDECRRPGDVEGSEAETMIDPILLHDRSIGVDQNGNRQILGFSVRLHLLGALPNDHEYLGS